MRLAGSSTEEFLADFTAAYTAEHLARFELLLERNLHKIDEDHPVIQELIGEDGDLVQLRDSVLQQCALHRRTKEDAGSTPEDYLFLFEEWKTLYGNLIPLHDRLRWLEIPLLRDQTRAFLKAIQDRIQAAFPQIRLPKHLLQLSYDLTPASNFVTDRIIVVEFGKLDYENPLAWPLLAHEIAHAVLQAMPGVGTTEEGGLKRRNLLRRWSLELGCDRIAQLIAGPAFAAAFVLRSLVEDIFEGTATHPPAITRIEAVADSEAGKDLAPKLFDTVADLARRSMRTMKPLRGSTKFTCHLCERKYDHSRKQQQQDRAYLKRYLQQLDRVLNRSSKRRQLRNLDQLVEELTAGQLVGASHDITDARRRYEAACSEAEAHDPENAESHRNVLKAFDYAAAALEDKPNDVLSIVTAAWMRYFDESPERFIWLSSDPQKRWDEFVENVRTTDELLMASVEAAEFHYSIRRIAHDVV